jgi:acetate kinase
LSEGCIAVLNAGSSSIKFALYDAATEGVALFRGQIEEIGLAQHLSATDEKGTVVAERNWGKAALDHQAATAEILKLGQELLRGRPVQAFGHRVVHGGTAFATPVRIDADVMAGLTALVPLAPLHQPHNLAPIEYIARVAPHLPQVACFDTAFHRTQSALTQHFALPREITASGIHRYGFHGLSYDFIVSRLREMAPDLAESRLIIAHLGNGASLCAVHDGKSVATTMGFTALDGLVMGTRAGTLDPGVLLYLLQERGLDAHALEDLLYRKSGLLGVSGISSDMRALRQSTAPEAAEAIALFVYRVVREIGSLAAALGGLDGLVFTAGIGDTGRGRRRLPLAGRGARRGAQSAGRWSHQRGRFDRVGVGRADGRGADDRPLHPRNTCWNENDRGLRKARAMVSG